MDSMTTSFGQVLLWSFWFFIWIAALMVWFRCLFDLFRDSSLGGWGKAGWAILLIFVPWLGALIYLIARGRSMNERQMAALSTLSPHEYRTVERLADLIIPVESGAPGALEAGVPAWIDMLAGVNDQLKTIYVDGVAWLDAAAKRRGSASFVTASPADQTALIDAIAYRKNESPDLAPGIRFFTWVRRMTVDGFYTSRVGMRDVYLGNSPSATFTVPAESLEYALRRSPI